MTFVKMWAVALLLQFTAFVASIPTISTSGTKFYDSNGNQFFIKGVTYAADEYIDLLSNGPQCQRDAALMQELGVNTIRIWDVDVRNNHDACMSAFENAGIYVLVALYSQWSAIDGSSAAWTAPQYNEFSSVMDAFAIYDNTLGFLVGGANTIQSLNASNAAVYVKAAALDLKKYRDGKGYRDIPIGFASADDISLVPYLQDYLACGSYGLDFFGQDNEKWCFNPTFIGSGYAAEYASASGYSIPILFSELDCPQHSPSFNDQAVILGPEMQGLWSGSIIFDWYGEAFGLVNYTSDSSSALSGAISGTPTPLPTGGFSNLKSQWQTLTPAGTPSSLYTPNVTPPACPEYTSKGWLVKGDVPLPTLNHAQISTRTALSLIASSKTAVASTSSAGSSTNGGDLGSYSSSEQTTSSRKRLSTGAVVGIAVGVGIPVIASIVVALLLWRLCLKRKSTPRLDLTPGGLEVAATSEPQSISEGFKHDPSDTSSFAPRASLAPDSAVTRAAVAHEVGPSALSSRPISTAPSELSTSPITPRVGSQQIFAASPQNNDIVELKANAPWENQAFPCPSIEITPAQAQQTPLLSNIDKHDDLVLRDESPTEG